MRENVKMCARERVCEGDKECKSERERACEREKGCDRECYKECSSVIEGEMMW